MDHRSAFDIDDEAGLQDRGAAAARASRRFGGAPREGARHRPRLHRRAARPRRARRSARRSASSASARHRLARAHSLHHVDAARGFTPDVVVIANETGRHERRSPSSRARCRPPASSSRSRCSRATRRRRRARRRPRGSATACAFTPRCRRWSSTSRGRALYTCTRPSGSTCRSGGPAPTTARRYSARAGEGGALRDLSHELNLVHLIAAVAHRGRDGRPRVGPRSRRDEDAPRCSSHRAVPARDRPRRHHRPSAAAIARRACAGDDRGGRPALRNAAHRRCKRPSSHASATRRSPSSCAPSRTATRAGCVASTTRATPCASSTRPSGRRAPGPSFVRERRHEHRRPDRSRRPRLRRAARRPRVRAQVPGHRRLRHQRRARRRARARPRSHRRDDAERAARAPALRVTTTIDDLQGLHLLRRRRADAGRRDQPPGPHAGHQGVRDRGRGAAPRAPSSSTSRPSIRASPRTICGPVLEQASAASSAASTSSSATRPSASTPATTSTRFEKIIEGRLRRGRGDARARRRASTAPSSRPASTARRRIKVAEAAKVIENTQRDLNIALMNELALIFDRMGIRTRDVLDAAGTKWNFLRVLAGPRRRPLHRRRSLLPDDEAEKLGYHPQVILAGPPHQRRHGRVRRAATREDARARRRARCRARASASSASRSRRTSPTSATAACPTSSPSSSTFGIEPLVHDPLADAAEARARVRHRRRPLRAAAASSTRVVLAVVAQSVHCRSPSATCLSIVKKGGVVVDVKSMHRPRPRARWAYRLEPLDSDVLFNSLQFLLFFPVVTALYFALPQRARWGVLLAASCCSTWRSSRRTSSSCSHDRDRLRRGPDDRARRGARGARRG